MSNLLAPIDNRIVKKSPDDLFENLFSNEDPTFQNVVINGTLDVSGVIDASGITFGNETLDDYQEYNFGLTFGGVAVFPATAKITKIGRQVCFELLPFASQSIIANGLISTSVAIPPDVRPPFDVSLIARATITGVEQTIGLVVRDNGLITLTRGAVSGTALTFTSFVSSNTIELTRTISLCYAV